jgi:hypothetical protein
MPGVLGPEMWPAWLGEAPADAHQLKAMSAPYPSEEMTCWPCAAASWGTSRCCRGQGRQPTTRLDRQAPPNEGDSKTAAQCSERRCPEILDRRVPTG